MTALKTLWVYHEKTNRHYIKEISVKVSNILKISSK